MATSSRVRRAENALGRAATNLDTAHLHLTPLDETKAPMVTAQMAVESAEDSVRTALRALAKLE